MWKLPSLAEENEIIEMCAGLYSEDPSPEPFPQANIENTLKNFRNNPHQGKAILLEIAGTPVGYALLVYFYSNEFGGNLCWIDEFFVKKEFRSQGHATKLLETLTQNPDSLGVEAKALKLEVTPNNSRARALYTRLGFTPAKNETLVFKFGSAQTIIR